MKAFLMQFTIVRDIVLFLFRIKWKKRNKHNFTVPNNKFDINKVKIRKLYIWKVKYREFWK